MPSTEMFGRIEQRIDRSNRLYSAEERRAELLLRNTRFQEELGLFPFPEFRPGFDTLSVRTRYRQALDQHLDGKQDAFRVIREEPKYTDINDAWMDFCFRWGIDWTWNGQEQSLSSHLEMGLEVFFREAGSNMIKKLQRDAQRQYPRLLRTKKWTMNITNAPTFICIKITPWTNLKDVRTFWPRIEQAKKDVFGYVEGEPSTFARDLCWFDLHNNNEFGKKSIRSIFKRWNSLKPRNEKVASHAYIQKGIERIKFCVERLTPVRRYSVLPISPYKRSRII